MDPYLLLALPFTVKAGTHARAHTNSHSHCLSLFNVNFVCVLQKPERDEWGSGVEALECALQLEKSVNQSLLDMHKVSSEHNDPHVSPLYTSHMHILNETCTLSTYFIFIYVVAS